MAPEFPKESFHAVIVSFLRDAFETRKDGLSKKIEGISNEKIIRMMFINYRGTTTEPRGLRLTKVGLTFMQAFFRCYQIQMPENTRLLPRHLLYLDNEATLPYYCDEHDGFYIFDAMLGTKLMLAGGEVAILIEAEGF